MEKVLVNGYEYDGYSVKFSKSTLLFIAGSKGVLGCGYFNIDTANKVGEAIAVVTGVKNFDDMLAAKVIKVSSGAESLGITLEMSGKEALERLK